MRFASAAFPVIVLFTGCNLAFGQAPRNGPGIFSRKDTTVTARRNGLTLFVHSFYCRAIPTLLSSRNRQSSTRNPTYARKRH